MCECDGCSEWRKEARGFPKSKYCFNRFHCVCCEGSVDCLGCNHNITDPEQIHYHANVLRKNPSEYTEDDWVLVRKMEAMKIDKLK